MLKGFIVDDEPLARDELAYLLGRTRQVHIVGEADSLETALQSIAEMEPDVVFLDIQLAEDNGMRARSGSLAMPILPEPES
ncbi:LytR/AlgR family response regulator transcription factor [Paenibacillus cellulositrophicus]|uniref:LytR/AlgR family response regulator transcription factor n=1 Tax=Paenibacillus cellulositrophicus TaxID=562959 RepID=UPI003D9899F2